MLEKKAIDYGKLRGKLFDRGELLRSRVHCAAYYGQTQIVMDILEDSSEKNPANDKLITPFHLAAEKGFVSICDYIIGGIDDKYQKDYTGRTPLHFAAFNGHSRVCELILNHTESTVDKMHAAQKGQLEVFEFLVEAVCVQNLLKLDHFCGKSPFQIAKNLFPPEKFEMLLEKVRILVFRGVRGITEVGGQVVIKIQWCQ